MRWSVLVIGVIVGFLLQRAGYSALGVWVWILSLLFALLMGRGPAKSKKKSNVLEPIVIESTRGAPYRIPERINLTYGDKFHGGSKDTPWKMVDKTFKPIADWLGGLIKGD